jgi:hypothetical protein
MKYSAALINQDSNWMLKNALVEAGKVYKVALTDFFLTGGQSQALFFTKANPDIAKEFPLFDSLDDSRSDVSRAIIRNMAGL